MKKSLSILLMILLCGFQLLAQQTVTGVVTDADDGTPLIGATVIIKGTTSGTVTDLDGNYSLSVPDDATLVFSFVGYVTQEVEVGNQTQIDLALVLSTTELDEIVVIGYGSRRRKDVTTAISTVESDELVKTNAMTPELAMQGRMSGVYVQSGGSEPFTRPTVRIRGTNTWGIAEPLYVIDGVPITEYGAGAESEYSAGGSDPARVRDLRSPVNVMSMINPNDIENISVLKDASAAAIYGVRAANGVILITTKKGKAGKPTIEFNYKYGVQNIPKTYEVLNVDDYVDLYNEMYRNNPDELANMPDVFKDSVPDAYLGNLPTIDWQTPIMNKNAPLADYNLKISGGTNNSNYYMSVTHNNTESVFINSWQKRYGFTTNVNTSPYKWLRTGINYRFIYTDIKDESGGGGHNGDLARMAYQVPPWQKIYGDGPSYLLGYEAPNNFYYTDYPNGFTVERKYGPESWSNPFGEMALNDRDYHFLRNLGSAYLEIEPISGLTFKGTYSIDWYYQRRMTWTDVNATLFGITPRDPLSYGIPGEDDTIGTYGERHTRNVNRVAEFTANYTKAFGNHNVDLLFNYMDQQYQWEAIHGGADQIPSRVEDFIPMNYAEREYNSIENDKDHYALQGILGRLGYNYDNKYYLDATLRRDGTSRFHPDNMWGTFPSFSAAWRISSESFMSSLNWLTDLKIRGGWGTLGNQETQAFAYLSLVSRNPTYAFGSTAAYGDPEGIFSWGAALPSYPNTDLKWEKTSTTNIGFDANILMSIDLSFEYYYKFTDGILQSTNLPTSVGAQNPPVANIASISNQGIEISVGYRNSVGDFNYSVNANLTTVKNEVLSLFDDAPLGGSQGRIEIGYPLHYIWGYELGGIFNTQEEIDAYQEKTTDLVASRQEPGDMWFEDVNGPPDPDAEEPQFYTEGPDSTVNSYDRTYLGKQIPGYFYGLNINLEWKGIDLSMFFQGVGDVQKVWGAHGTAMVGLGNNMNASVLDRWTPTNTGGDIPRAVAADPAENNRFSSRTVYDAGFLRFANLQLGYTVPASVARRLGIFERMRVWVGGSNLFVITPYPGLDPENDIVPIPRVMNMGVDLRF